MKRKITVLWMLFVFIYINSGCAQNSTPIKIMTTNIRYANPNDGINIWDNRKEWLCGGINFMEVDILGAQEVINSQLNDMIQLLPTYAHVGVGRNGDDEGEYCPIFYKREKYEVLDSKTFWLSQTPDKENSIGWDAALPRIVTWVKIKDRFTGKEFYFFNTHFDHRGEVARLESAELLLKKVKQIAGEFPFFVTGDFNFAPSVEAYEVLVAKNKENYFLKDTRSEAQKVYGPEYTFNGFKLEPDQDRERIDYIFYHGPISIIGHHVLDGQRGPRYISDHFPIIVDALLE